MFTLPILSGTILRTVDKKDFKIGFKTSLACLDEGNDDGGYEGDDESRRYAWASLLPSGRNP